jgi:hypothetical protein
MIQCLELHRFLTLCGVGAKVTWFKKRIQYVSPDYVRMHEIKVEALPDIYAEFNVTQDLLNFLWFHREQQFWPSLKKVKEVGEEKITSNDPMDVMIDDKDEEEDGNNPLNTPSSEYNPFDVDDEENVVIILNQAFPWKGYVRSTMMGMQPLDSYEWASCEFPVSLLAAFRPISIKCGKTFMEMADENKVVVRRSGKFKEAILLPINPFYMWSFLHMLDLNGMVSIGVVPNAPIRMSQGGICSYLPPMEE